MSKMTVMWGVEGCNEIISQLNDLKTTINSMEKSLPEKLARVGLSEAQQASITIGASGVDGNTLGSYFVSTTSNGAELVNQGADVAYIEYGTGMMGQQSSHPDAGKVGWQYYVPTKYKRTVGGMKGWFYKNKLTGKLTFTQGIVGTKAMYKAALAMRKNVINCSKEILKKSCLR